MPADADPERIAHQSACRNCGADVLVPMRESRLERHPWRLVWWCKVCGKQSKVPVHPEILLTLLSWDRVYGTSLSMREVADMAKVDLEELNRAIVDELL